MIPHVADILLTQRSGHGLTARPAPVGARPRLLLPARAVLTGGVTSPVPRRSFSLLWRARHRADRAERAKGFLRRWFFAALIAAGLVFAGVAVGQIVDLPLAREAAL